MGTSSFLNMNVVCFFFSMEAGRIYFDHCGGSLFANLVGRKIKSVKMIWLISNLGGIHPSPTCGANKVISPFFIQLRLGWGLLSLKNWEIDSLH